MMLRPPDSSAPLLGVTVKNGALAQPVVSYTYDNANRLIGISQAAGAINAGETQQIALTYDAAGQRTQTRLANGSTVTYTRDAAGQLTAIVYNKADGALIGDLTYEYDAGGHRTSMGGSLAQLNLPDADVTDASYDANDRLLVWGGKTYAYDDNGNLVSDGTSSCQWDERNRLSRIGTGAGELASFQYDSLGRRSGKTIAGETTGFLYDGSTAVQELAGTSSTSAVTAHMLTGGIDEVFLRTEGNDGSIRNSVFSDANNNTLMLSSAAEDKLVGYAYEPYGATTADAAAGSPQQYSGRENDSPGNDQGLYYYRARYYMPGITRFISEDPIGWASGQTNRYAYVGGNPLGLRDPFGLDAWDELENASAGIGDGLTLGLTRWIRNKLDIQESTRALDGTKLDW